MYLNYLRNGKVGPNWTSYLRMGAFYTNFSIISTAEISCFSVKISSLPFVLLVTLLQQVPCVPVPDGNRGVFRWGIGVPDVNRAVFRWGIGVPNANRGVFRREIGVPNVNRGVFRWGIWAVLFVSPPQKNNNGASQLAYFLANTHDAVFQYSRTGITVLRILLCWVSCSLFTI